MKGDSHEEFIYSLFDINIFGNVSFVILFIMNFFGVLFCDAKMTDILVATINVLSSLS